MPLGCQLPVKEGCGLGGTNDVNPSGCLEHEKLSHMYLVPDVSALGLSCSIIGHFPGPSPKNDL